MRLRSRCSVLSGVVSCLESLWSDRELITGIVRSSIMNCQHSAKRVRAERTELMRSHVRDTNTEPEYIEILNEHYAA